MVFPRYHQLDSTRKLIFAAGQEKAGYNYLIQHSAGSGKTNSISWLSHRLASLHDSKDEKIFDCVIVITDRTVLDKQLQDAIYQIEHQQGVVKAIDQDSKQLAEALIDGTKIVITTLQKFPFVLRGLMHAAGAANQDELDGEKKKKAKEWEAAIANRKYAVIVDEAHSSQTGEAAREMKAILGDSGAINEEEDWEDRLNRVMESRGRQTNISFFAFTATPKGKTLETFGRKNHEGKSEAFHTYSMRQAIEEGPMLMKGIYKTIHANAGKENVKSIVAAGEGNTIEFKSTLRVNLHTHQNDPKMEHSVLKTIAAFLNSKEGGTLVVGVDDNGTALGIEIDKFPNEDKMNLHLGNLIKGKLGSASMLHIKPHFETFQEKRVLVVDCVPSGSAVYLKNGTSEEFFIRAGASTAALQPSEMTDYIKQRFF